MKKLLLLVMVLLMAVSYLAGCGQRGQDLSVSDEDSVNAEVGAESQEKGLSPAEEKLVGVWQARVDRTMAIWTFDDDYSFRAADVEREKDGHYVVGTWRLVGNTLTMHGQYQIDGTLETLELQIIEVTNSTLTLTDGEDAVTFERAA